MCEGVDKLLRYQGTKDGVDGMERRSGRAGERTGARAQSSRLRPRSSQVAVTVTVASSLSLISSYHHEKMIVFANYLILNKTQRSPQVDEFDDARKNGDNDNGEEMMRDAY